MTTETLTGHLVAEILRWQPAILFAAALWYAHRRFFARKRRPRLAPKGTVEVDLKTHGNPRFSESEPFPARFG